MKKKNLGKVSYLDDDPTRYVFHYLIIENLNSNLLFFIVKLLLKLMNLT
jgi:hypothetical protein